MWVEGGIFRLVNILMWTSGTQQETVTCLGSIHVERVDADLVGNKNRFRWKCSEFGLLWDSEKIAKTGSLCCVAARPHGSNAGSRDWSMGPNEPYWRTNTSFSPPPTRWDFRFQSEGLPYSLSDGIQLYDGSPTSSNSKESRAWVRGNQLYDLQYAASDGTGVFLSSPSDLSQGPQWTPPAIQEISIDDYETLTRKGKSSYVNFWIVFFVEIYRLLIGFCSQRYDVLCMFYNVYSVLVLSFLFFLKLLMFCFQT